MRQCQPGYRQRGCKARLRGLPIALRAPLAWVGCIGCRHSRWPLNGLRGRYPTNAFSIFAARPSWSSFIRDSVPLISVSSRARSPMPGTVLTPNKTGADTSSAAAIFSAVSKSGAATPRSILPMVSRETPLVQKAAQGSSLWLFDDGAHSHQIGVEAPLLTSFLTEAAIGYANREIRTLHSQK